MSFTEKTPPVKLSLDTELIDAWCITSSFYAGHLSGPRIVAISLRGIATQGLFASVYRADMKVITMITTRAIKATQAEALNIAATRYISFLGDIAVPSNVIHSGMNADLIIQTMIAPYGFDQLYQGDGYVSQADWNLMDECPDPLTLDATDHLKEALRHKQSQ